MSMIERIAAAEQAAEALILSAQADARTAAAEAKAARETALEQAAEQERQRTRDAVTQAEKDGAALAGQLHLEQQHELEQVLSAAAQKRDAAVRSLLERVEAAV